MRLEPHPKPWTHHHTHRLYHMSMGLCFAFAALAMVGTMATVWLSAGADTVTDIEDVTITATVGGVSPGPVGGGSSGSHVNPQLTPNPTISIVAEPQGEIPVQAGAYVFSQAKPAFSGTTSVPNGLVFVTIRGTTELNSTARATPQGTWQWVSPINLNEGNHTIRVAVFDSFDLTRSGSAQVPFVIDLPEAPVPTVPPGTQPPTTPPSTPPSGTPGTTPTPGPTLPPIPEPEPDMIFGIFFSVLKDYKYITAGEPVMGAVSLVSSISNQLENLDVQYTVTAPDGTIILLTTDMVSFSKQSQFVKSFMTAPLTPPGDYTVTVTATYQGVPSIASDTFRIIAPVSSGTSNIDKQRPVIIWSLLGLLWLLFIVLVIIAYRRIRHHTREIRGVGAASAVAAATGLGAGPFGDQQ